MLSRQTLLLKPMQTAVSGYARVQTENGRRWVQLHARGLTEARVRLFGYLKGGGASELGSAQVNEHGEASLEAEFAEAPARLQGLVLLADPPKPLLIGLCGAQDAGGLLEMRNAALAICERLTRPVPEQAQPARRQEQRSTTAPKPLRGEKTPRRGSLPREVFLPAIDPAQRPRACGVTETSSLRKPVSRLRAMIWPGAFAPLRVYFSTRMPVWLLPWPGWRFVSAADGLWLGREAVDGRVRRVAYIYANEAPPETAGRCRTIVGEDGAAYQVMIQVLPSISKKLPQR